MNKRKSNNTGKEKITGIMLRHRGYNHTQSQKKPDGQNEQETTTSALYWNKKEFNPLGGQLKHCIIFFSLPPESKHLSHFCFRKQDVFI